MKKINCICEKKVKIVYKHLKEKLIVNRPINGAVLNIISSNVFTLENSKTKGVYTSDYLHTGSLFNGRLQITAPLICKGKIPQKILYTPYNQNFYFLNSFQNSNNTSPKITDFKESKELIGVFKYYYVNSLPKIPNVANHNVFSGSSVHELTRKLEAISSFYNSLLKDNSTPEGSFVLTNILLLLFNSKEITKSVRPQQFSQMQSYLFNELQILDENIEHEISIINIDCKDDSGNIAYNLLELRILNGFCKAFNRLSSENKKIIKNIFNEKSQN